ncbi:MAG: glycosyltransferase [Candidatus Bathyarchaeota archaeon]|nr:glycosyltransferase [Candidatus Bathyarchaeota archaeon]MDH5788362.1 glycosyltransferase [Candidatus Bathyarchaeota archaeon]
MHSGLKVTLGVCVKNCESLIEETIESVNNQDFPHKSMEVIFVDDGSEDRTLSTIQNCLPKLTMQTKIFHHQWKGLGATRNVVVNHAEGEYIIWVDGDMRLNKDFVKRQVAFMDANPCVGIAKGRYGMCAQASLVGDLENMEFVVTGSRSKEKANSVPLGTGGSIYRVKAIRGAGGFDPDIKGSGEDVDAEYRVRAAGWLFDLTTAVFYERRRASWRALWNEYYWHGSGISYLFGKDRRIVNSYKLWPPAIIVIELLRVVVAYKLTGRKVVLLLPFHYVFKRTAWFLGFIRRKF